METISLCMIVKNEEKRLPQALKSAQGQFDEMIVVDTGSTDRTKEIAESFGCRVFDFEWNEDFSAARNFSIEQVTTDWLFILDADEVLAPDAIERFREALPYITDSIAGIAVTMINLLPHGEFGKMQHTRIFRRGKVWYSNTVHNHVHVTGEVMALGTVTFEHHGYNEPPDVMDAKLDRRISMISAWVDRAEPETRDALLAHSYLCQAYGMKKEYAEKCLVHAKEAHRLAKKLNADYGDWPRFIHPMIASLFALNRMDEALPIAYEAAEKVDPPPWPDPLFYAIMAHHHRKEWGDVCKTANVFVGMQAYARGLPEEYAKYEVLSLPKVEKALQLWGDALRQLKIAALEAKMKTPEGQPRVHPMQKVDPRPPERKHRPARKANKRRKKKRGHR